MPMASRRSSVSPIATPLASIKSGIRICPVRLSTLAADAASSGSDRRCGRGRSDRRPRDVRDQVAERPPDGVSLPPSGSDGLSRSEPRSLLVARLSWTVHDPTSGLGTGWMPVIKPGVPRQRRSTRRSPMTRSQRLHRERVRPDESRCQPPGSNPAAANSHRGKALVSAAPPAQSG
jgi:hypothetical protein